MTKFEFSLVSLSQQSDLDRRGFDCGEPKLNQWFIEIAGQAERRGVARTFVALSDNQLIIGFFTLTGKIINTRFSHQQNRFHKIDQSAFFVELSQLAVDLGWQGSGYGEKLIHEAFLKTIVVGQNLGVQGVLVKPLNKPLFDFYKRIGFLEIEGDPSRLAIPFRIIKKALLLYIPHTDKGLT